MTILLKIAILWFDSSGGYYPPNSGESDKPKNIWVCWVRVFDGPGFKIPKAQPNLAQPNLAQPNLDDLGCQKMIKKHVAKLG